MGEGEKGGGEKWKRGEGGRGEKPGDQGLN